jgi:hypothetical protein
MKYSTGWLGRIWVVVFVALLVGILLDDYVFRPPAKPSLPKPASAPALKP